jgi:hypothetical protein
MDQVSKNKLLTWLVLLLIVANAITITMFWVNKKQHPPANPAPNEFLIKELKLDKSQQEKLDLLVKEHRGQVESIRGKLKQAKDKLFSMVKAPETSDSVKHVAAADISKLTEEIDLFTLAHFQKVRNICNPEQQKKFDEIIGEVTAMMAPRPPQRPPGGGPPRNGPGQEGPPPPGN